MTTATRRPAKRRPAWQREWVRTPGDETAVRAGCTFDLAAAERVRSFFARWLRHSKGEWAGQPFTLMPWQWRDVIAPLFGWKRPDGTRRFRKAFVFIPKKNGKSTLAAGIGLYMLMGDREPGAEIYSAANDREQAGIVHREALNMAEASPGLMAELQVNRSTHNIAYPRTRSYYRALSSDAPGKEGLNAHCILCDELHVWYGRELWDTLRYAFRARRQGLLFVITTAGDDPLSVCREQYDYAKGVLAGRIADDRLFAYIREADPEDDWKSTKVWRRANPAAGIIIRQEDFAADAREAEKTPASQASFKRYTLNIWATAANPWFKGADWDACAGPGPVNEDTLAGRDCWCGMDLASTQDITAAVLVFPDGPDRFILVPRFWIPEDRLADGDANAAYRVWAAQGWLRTTPGNVCDYAFIKHDLAADAKRFRVRQWMFDPWNAESLTQELEKETGVERVKFGQTIGNFAGPCKDLERLVLARGILHGGHPVLAWMAGHVSVRQDPNGNKRPVKPQGQDQRKIDGITAALMGLAGAQQGKGTGGRSVYEDRDPITI